MRCPDGACMVAMRHLRVGRHKVTVRRFLQCSHACCRFFNVSKERPTEETAPSLRNAGHWERMPKRQASGVTGRDLTAGAVLPEESHASASHDSWRRCPATATREGAANWRLFSARASARSKCKVVESDPPVARSGGPLRNLQDQRRSRKDYCGVGSVFNSLSPQSRVRRDVREA